MDFVNKSMISKKRFQTVFFMMKNFFYWRDLNDHMFSKTRRVGHSADITYSIVHKIVNLSCPYDKNPTKRLSGSKSDSNTVNYCIRRLQIH